MSPTEKRPTGKRPNAKTPPKNRAAAKAQDATVAGLALEKALEALRDERTRKMLMEHGKSILGRARGWHKERQASAEHSGEARRLGDQFGQRKLERRVEKLASSVEALCSGRPELAQALAPVNDAVTQIGLSVDIAGRLPIVKRKQAHLRVDRELDRLEQTLFEASFPFGNG